MSNDLKSIVCPVCKFGTMMKVGERTGGFSVGKAAIGAVIAGPIGLIGGVLGKKR